jgi:threonine dehydrogenase-like Zn-dependent dehydrogenase
MREGCYAASGPLALHWSAVSSGARGTDWSTFVGAIADLPDGQLWRHNQAGDLPGDGRTVDPVALGQLVAANTGRRGFTYSHYRDADSLTWIRHANQWGFTINLSANDLRDADALADTGAGPVVVVLPSNATDNTRTPAGRRVVVCPATQRDDVSCDTCQLCARQRDAIVGFPAHGTRKRTIDIKLAA